MTYDRHAHMRQLAYARSCATEETRAKIAAASKAAWARGGDGVERTKAALMASQKKARDVRYANSLATRDARFWAKVERTDECWLWTGAKNNKGYGQVRHDGKCILATHYALKLDGRPREDGMVARHGCDNPQCVNPAHLEWGTQRENMQDAKSRGRMNLSGLALGRGRAT